MSNLNLGGKGEPPRDQHFSRANEVGRNGLRARIEAQHFESLILFSVVEVSPSLMDPDFGLSPPFGGRLKGA